MEELTEWLDANKISFKMIDNEVIEIEDFGKMFLADLSGVKSIFKVRMMKCLSISWKILQF